MNAVYYCHKNGVIHLDIKPQNVMIVIRNKSYTCKLCDFGCSVKFGNTTEEDHRQEVQGTIRYMSPEALKGVTVVPKSDIYSIGIVMWQLESNRLPYSSISSNEVVAYRVVKEQIRPDSPEIQEEPSVNPFENFDRVESSPVVTGNYFKRINTRNINVKQKSNGEDHHQKRGGVSSKKNLISEFDLVKLVDEFKTDSLNQLNPDIDRKFLKLYKSCWDHEPDIRPSAVIILSRLKEWMKEL